MVNLEIMFNLNVKVAAMDVLLVDLNKFVYPVKMIITYKEKVA